MRKSANGLVAIGNVLATTKLTENGFTDQTLDRQFTFQGEAGQGAAQFHDQGIPQGFEQQVGPADFRQ